MFVRFLAAMTVVGFLIPNAMVIAFVVQEGLDTGRYFGLWVDSLPSLQLTIDLALVSLVFAVWSMIDAHRRSARWWYVIPATLLVGICFAVPLYLFLRERQHAGVFEVENADR